MEAFEQSGVVAAIAAAVGAVLASAVNWRRIDRVDGVTAAADAQATSVAAITAAYERIVAGQDKQVELLHELMGEQSKRIDLLQSQLHERDQLLRERDDIIRRLREHLDVYYRALLEKGALVDPPPDIPTAPERRSHPAPVAAEPIVQAARETHS